ncbi:MAG: segregation/condensation protein A [Vallitaleaceae bacterium]|nr:segregation/condensation protein A [Vallitaleaceae bacterium]
MSIPVKITVFEGPLDLLLHLIDKNKLNIYDIPIAQVTDQYLEYIHAMEKGQMEVMSEFIEMAAILINIKSKTLLPVEEVAEVVSDDPRQDLIDKLIEYKKFKLIAKQLKSQQEDAGKIVFKGATLPEEILAYIPVANPKEILGNLDFAKMYEVFRGVMKKKMDKIDPIRSQYGEIKKESFTVQDKIDALRAMAKEYTSFSFKDLLLQQDDRISIIVTFLAILELMKMGAIKIIQELLFDDIIIEFIEGEDNGN